MNILDDPVIQAGFKINYTVGRLQGIQEMVPDSLKFSIERTIQDLELVIKLLEPEQTARMLTKANQDSIS